MLQIPLLSLIIYFLQYTLCSCYFIAIPSTITSTILSLIIRIINLIYCHYISSPFLPKIQNKQKKNIDFCYLGNSCRNPSKKAIKFLQILSLVNLLYYNLHSFKFLSSSISSIFLPFFSLSIISSLNTKNSKNMIFGEKCMNSLLKYTLKENSMTTI